MRVLMVAEKPSIAQAIAKVLSKGHYDTSKGKGTPILTWDGQFKGQNASFIMTSVLGHVYNLDFPPSIGWQVDPRTLFSAPTERKEANPNQHICSHLQHSAKGCHVLVLWLDCDREGENIGFEVMENCEPKMVQNHQVYRARFSAITPQDVNKAMATLGKPNKNEALSVDARREIDLKVGVAFTRYQTSTFHFRYANLDAHLISYGPCQTPTLGFCVDRYDEIQRFKPTPYYKLVAHIMRQGVKTKIKWQRGKIMKDRGAVLGYQNQMNSKGASWAKCVDVKTTTSKFVRPIPLNTVALMKVASSQLGLGPHHCMSIAEHLYINGWISYPRTESSSYPKNFDISEVVQQHISHPQWGAVAQDLMTNGLNRAKTGVDHGDHPPITPMSCAVRDQDLSGNEWRIYEYITCHFLATVCQDAVVENQTILYEIGGEMFASAGSSIKEKGFLEVMPWARSADRYLPTVKIGDSFEVESVSVKEGFTKPPGFITETDLISLMEKHGIGTDASIPTHIENIQRNYVKLHERNRTLEPNKLGVALVHGYHRIDPELVLPKVRANIENLCSKIALGEATYESVLQSTLNLFLSKYDNFIDNISKMDELFHASFSSLGDAEVNTRLKPKCGKCERFMKYIDTKPHRLYCVICEEVYSMPKDGSIKSTETLCPLDGFELVVHTNRKGKSVRLCPKCYNAPTFPGMKANSNCAQCPNQDCPSNLSQFTVDEECPHCDVGFLSIEPANGRRIDCNLCSYHILLPHEANKITMGKGKCSKCSMKLIKFKYNEKNNPQTNKSLSEFEACVRCDEVMSPLCPVKGVPLSHEERMQQRRGGKAGRAPRGGRSQHHSEPVYSLDVSFSNTGEAITSTRKVEAAREEITIQRGRGRRGKNAEPEKLAPSSNTVDILSLALDKTKLTPSPFQDVAISSSSTPSQRNATPTPTQSIPAPSAQTPSTQQSENAPSDRDTYTSNRNRNRGGKANNNNSNRNNQHSQSRRAGHQQQHNNNPLQGRSSSSSQSSTKQNEQCNNPSSSSPPAVETTPSPVPSAAQQQTPPVASKSQSPSQQQSQGNKGHPSSSSNRGSHQNSRGRGGHHNNQRGDNAGKASPKPVQYKPKAAPSNQAPQ